MPRLLKTSARQVSRRSLRRKSGFSLMEILVVIAILGLLVGLTVAKLGGIFDNAKVDTANLLINTQLKLPLFAYKKDVLNFPSTADGLQALIQAPASKAHMWRGPYLEPAKIPIDPWGEPLQYQFPGTHNKDSFDLWSKGVDGQSGTADDIGNWDKAPTETK